MSFVGPATEPDVTYDAAGYYAYPYHAYPYHAYGYDYGHEFDPGLDYYGLPYATDEVGEHEPFDYGAFDDDLV